MRDSIKKPMLAGKAPEDLADLTFPLLASPKLDGIRCLMIDGRCLSRTYKPIPNDYVREWCELHLPDGFDGELLLRDWTALFRDVSSAIMKKTGAPDFTYAAFDFVADSINKPFAERYKDLEFTVANVVDQTRSAGKHLFRVRHWLVESVAELTRLHTQFLQQGFEGTMVRSLDGPYKEGRATTRQGTLLKIKNFEDEEATIIGFEEQQTNTNAAELDNFGRTKRSSAKAGKVGKGTLGKFLCRFDDGTEFKCGTGLGLDDALRADVWARQEYYLGQTIKVKHQPDPGGRLEGQKPRIPVFIGFRNLEVDG
jgi:DNA ligase-1